MLKTPTTNLKSSQPNDDQVCPYSCRCHPSRASRARLSRLTLPVMWLTERQLSRSPTVWRFPSCPSRRGPRRTRRMYLNPCFKALTKFLPTSGLYDINRIDEAISLSLVSPKALSSNDLMDLLLNRVNTTYHSWAHREM